MPQASKSKPRGRRRAQRARQVRRGPRARALWRGLLLLLVALVALPVCAVGLLSQVAPPTTAFMLQRAAQARAEGDDGFSIAYRWVPRRAIHGHAALAVMAAEDQRFPTHHGVDWTEVRAALSASLLGKPVRGASTLTQQLAKNLFLWPERSLLRKGLEAYLAALIEMSWPKARILEVYLNVVEFGDGVYGVEAASRRFYGHSAQRLSAEEAALLAAVLPAPKRFRVKRPSAHLRDKQRWVREQMRVLGAWGWLSRIDWQSGRQPPRARTQMSALHQGSVGFK